MIIFTLYWNKLTAVWVFHRRFPTVGLRGEQKRYPILSNLARDDFVLPANGKGAIGRHDGD